MGRTLPAILKRSGHSMSKLATSFHEKRLELRERHINYAEFPNSGPPLLLIHGISGRWQDWETVVDGFSANWHIFAVDLRGHGESSWVTGEYHWRYYASDQADFIEQVIGEPSFVVGHSLGGATALGLNAQRSDLVRAVVYEDPPLFLRQVWQDNSFRNEFAMLLEELETNPDHARMAGFLRELHPEYDEARRDERAEKLLKMDPDVFRSTISGRARANWRTEDLLVNAESPGLLLQAEPELGAALHDEESERALELLPDAEYEKWDDSGHGMHASFPERFVTRVDRFFANHH